MFQTLNKNFLIGALAIILAATMWSLDGILIRPNFYAFPAINIVFIEHLLWAILLSPFLIMWWKKIKKLSKKSMFDVLWVCFFWWLLGTLAITEAYFAGFRWETTLSTVIILQKLQPIFALFLARIVLGEKLSKRFYIWAAVAIVSAYMIAFGGMWAEFFNTDFFTTPAFYAILAAFAFGSSTVFWKDLVDHLGFRTTVAMRFTITSLLAFIALLIFWDITSLWSFESTQWKLFWVIVCTSWAVALSFYYFGLKRVNASSATLFELTWPLSGVVFDWYFNGNILTSTQIIFSVILLICFFAIISEQKKSLT